MVTKAAFNYSKNRNVVKYYYNFRYILSIVINIKMSFNPVIKAEFSASLLQSPDMILQKCRFDAQELSSFLKTFFRIL